MGTDADPSRRAVRMSCPQDDEREWPAVDVVMPVRNEEATLRPAVRSIVDQEYPGTIRILLGMAPSDDGTEAVGDELATDGIVVVPNAESTISCGLNRAIRAGNAPIIVRVDAHSELAPGYVRRAVEVLAETGAGNVGGRQVPVPRSRFESAVAAATSSWLGTGGAAYRTGTAAGAVDTVYLGVFDRQVIEEIGLYDEEMIRNEDYELNIRLRQAGHVVWFDPELEVRYRPRSSFRELARQYFDYGTWKAEVLRQHPRSVRLRQLLPPLAVVGSVAGLLTAARKPLAAVVPLGYLGLVAVGAGRSSGEGGRVRVAAVAVAIHWSWAAGLFRGVVAARHRVR